ncbi:MAG: 4a-hydroxytetrahydrobiopterin dehydratase [Ignavibacteriae bacterium HGW-Ignavibacteriae-4]|jgi:4a-hydroxytetrahydrobiopterin dehydratase|nr:MAG: 4a-hydroxytetrahydrobiopterin dehydratase [Ignavibacteriae bacterium HGW-Ignavibacteriae-4]
MSRPELLDDERIDDELEDLVNWKKDGKEIKREIVAADFASAIGFVNSVAIISESMDHHPNIEIYGWNKVRISVSTHDAGGLTELDFKLANKIDSIKLNANEE